MPALPTSNPAQFVQGAPVLHVADVEATAAFYRDVLGFTWDFGDEHTRWCGAIIPPFTLLKRRWPSDRRPPVSVGQGR